MASLNKRDLPEGTGGRDTDMDFVLPSGDEWRARASRVIQLLDEWAAEDPHYDAETWPSLKKALDENRMSSRAFFNDSE